MTPSDRAALREAAQAVIDTQGHDPECHAYTRMMAGIHPAAVLALLDEVERMRGRVTLLEGCLRDMVNVLGGGGPITRAARAALGDGA